MDTQNSDREIARNRRVSELAFSIKVRRGVLAALLIAALGIWGWEYYAEGKLRLWPTLFLVVIGVEGGLRRIRALRTQLGQEEKA